MKHYEDLVDRLRTATKLPLLQALMNEAADAIQSLTAADVRPVVRGRWGKCVGENGVTSACRCSLCGFEDNRFSVFNYCPNCGADMRETNDEKA